MRAFVTGATRATCDAALPNLREPISAGAGVAYSANDEQARRELAYDPRATLEP